MLLLSFDRCWNCTQCCLRCTSMVKGLQAGIQLWWVDGGLLASCPGVVYFWALLDGTNVDTLGLFPRTWANPQSSPWKVSVWMQIWLWIWRRCFSEQHSKWMHPLQQAALLYSVCWPGGCLECVLWFLQHDIVTRNAAFSGSFTFFSDKGHPSLVFILRTWTWV